MSKDKLWISLSNNIRRLVLVSWILLSLVGFIWYRFCWVIQGMHRNLVSAQEISRATANFFTDILAHTSSLVEILEENKSSKCHQLHNFERMFKVKGSHFILNETNILWSHQSLSLISTAFFFFKLMAGGSFAGWTISPGKNCSNIGKSNS